MKPFPLVRISVFFVFFIFRGLPVFAEPAVSVSYFSDLSAEEGFPALSKAFAEIVVGNLSRVRGIRIVERENLQKLMKEMELGLSGMVNESTSPKIGKLLGAEYLVAGSYMVSSKEAMISFRLIHVETAKIVESGALSGAPDDLMTLLLDLSYGIARGLQKLSPEITFSKSDMKALKISLKGVNDFGTALDLADRGDYLKAGEVLKGLVVKSPQFDYAKRELALVEKRVKEYDRIRQEQLKQEAAETGDWKKFNKVTLSLLTSMQYSKLYRYCLKAREKPPEAPEEALTGTAEMIDYYISFSSFMLKKWDTALDESEKFLKNYPASMYYQSVKLNLSRVLDEIKSVKGRREHAEREVKKIRAEAGAGEERNFLNYRIANAYFSGQVYDSALTWYKKLNLSELEKKSVTGDSVLYFIFMCYYHLLDRKEAEKILNAVDRLYPDSSFLQSMRTMIALFPE